MKIVNVRLGDSIARHDDAISHSVLTVGPLKGGLGSGKATGRIKNHQKQPWSNLIIVLSKEGGRQWVNSKKNTIKYNC